MGFLFYNNWPYSDTYFPGMEDHQDPVNHDYFAGLMTELARIEYYLGLNPQGSFKDIAERLSGIDSTQQTDYNAILAILGTDVQRGFSDVRDKLELHDHSGGYFGAPLLSYDVVNWDFGGFLTNYGTLQTSSGKGCSFAGFNYYDCIYFGPSEASGGYRPMQCYNVSTGVHSWQDLTTALAGPTFSQVWGDYAYTPVSGVTDKIFKFGILDWSESLLTPGGGALDPYSSAECGDYLWFGTFQSPGKLIRMLKSDDSMTVYDLQAGENQASCMASDGTNIWIGLNTSPVQLVKWRASDNARSGLTLTGLSGTPVFMGVDGDWLWVFTNDGTTDFARLNMVTGEFRVYEADWAKAVRSGVDWGDYWLLSTQSGGQIQAIAINKGTLIAHISSSFGSGDYGNWCSVNGTFYIVCGDVALKFDRIATISPIP